MLDLFGEDWFVGLLMLTPLLQATAFLIETSSWLVRAQSTPDDVGFYVGRSNIYLYSARMFTLAFTASLAFAVESGESVNVIWTIIYSTFVLSAVIHAILMFDSSREKAILYISAALMLPRRGKVGTSKGIHNFRGKVFWLTLSTSIIFSISLIAPIAGAIIVPEYRLSISYLGQAINFIGTMIILFFVDQILFRAMDTRTIDKVIMTYVSGRITGFMLAGAAFAYIGANI